MEENKDFSRMPFGTVNYRNMAIGVLVLIIGFLIMASDSEEFGFGFLGLTLGPIIVMIGFGIQFYAILKKN